MKMNADIVVIGGGAVGCATAYFLAKSGIKNVVLLERKCLTYGSTGRCGAGIRQQWGTEMNLLLSKAACELYLQIGEESGFGDIEFRQSGYLLITNREAGAEMLNKNLQLQQKLGVKAVRLSREDAKELVPDLNTENMVGAFFCPEDGYINPFKATYAYAMGAEKLGVTIYQNTNVVDFIRVENKIKAVVTDKGIINCDIVVNAAGFDQAVLARMLGMNHQIVPERRQILITEPVEPRVNPMVKSFDHGTHCLQVKHGGFLMGYGLPNEPYGYNFPNSSNFVSDMAKKILTQLPFLKDVRVVRQWTGYFDTTPDAQPVLGGVPEYDNYVIACGAGKGFMLAPIVGKITSEYINGQKSIIDINILNVERFKTGALVKEPAIS